MKYNKILIEGLDRLGKSTLADNIQSEFGFYQKIHFGKPQKLKYYAEHKRQNKSAISISEEELYQRHCFENMFKIIDSHGTRVIFDRAHLGETVYSPIYRKYTGDYVYEFELCFSMDNCDDALLVLLTEDFQVSKHFVDDGLSFDISKREQEQELFIKAFNRSSFLNKKMVCVTDAETGKFRNQEDILREVIA